MLIPLGLGLLGLGYLVTRKSSPSTAPPAVRTVIAVGPADAYAWSWRVLSLPGGGFLGQWRQPHSPGFAPVWIDVPGGAAPSSDVARDLALAQIALAQAGDDVVDSGFVSYNDGRVIGWRVMRTPEGLYQGQVESDTESDTGWVSIGPAILSPLYARNVALEELGMSLSE